MKTAVKARKGKIVNVHKMAKCWIYKTVVSKPPPPDDPEPPREPKRSQEEVKNIKNMM